jgi:hypothetical protein
MSQTIYFTQPNVISGLTQSVGTQPKMDLKMQNVIVIHLYTIV